MQVADKKEMKVRVPKGAHLTRFLLSPGGKILMATVALVALSSFGVFTYYYVKFSRVVDEKLRKGPFTNTAKIFAAPRIISVGDPITVDELEGELRRNGYSRSERNPLGSYRVTADSVEIYPGPDSYFKREGALLKTNAARFESIPAARMEVTRSSS